MFSKIKKRFLTFATAVVTSIAFYPTLITILSFLLSLALLYLESNKVSEFLFDKLPFLFINDANTARSILGTIIGGIISLTVFSFSMVMILLNQASTNFSPRLLPGLISDKKNQIVLGFYIGTIIYNIIVLISVSGTSDDYILHGLTILVGIIMGITSLSLFVFFIHSISTGIQINNILENIFNQSKKRLEKIKQHEQEINIDEVKIEEKGFSVKSDRSGYFYGINQSMLLSLANQFETDFKVVLCKDTYMLPGLEILFSDKELNEEQQKKVKRTVLKNGKREAKENYALGIQQITEVGIKAMSPGINDPGTAIISIDYLTELFAIRMKMGQSELYRKNESDYTVELSIIPFDTLLYRSLAAYRQYCKHDVLLMKKLINMLQYLLVQDAKDDYYKIAIRNELRSIEEDIENNIDNTNDKAQLYKLLNN